MDIIKRQIKLIPDKDINLIIMLTGSIHDIGFFDTFIPLYRYYGYGYYGYNNFYDSEGLGLENLL